MTQENKNRLKSSLINSFIAVAVFFFYYASKDIEFVRDNFGDFGYDLTIKGFSFLPSDTADGKKPNIIIITVDEKYLDEHNLSDGEGGLRFNYTPRYIVADLLTELNTTISENSLDHNVKPKAVFIDYLFGYPGDISGRVTDDDQKLIDALNKYSTNFPIYIPTIKNGIFLEKQNLHENVRFISMKASKNRDLVQRGYQSYICKDKQAVEHIALALTPEYGELPMHGVCNENNENNITNAFKHYFQSRILYKNISNVNASNWKNIRSYSALELENSSIGEDFNNTIILIGSNYKKSGDVHKTPAGTMSGVMIIANTIATRYFAEGNIQFFNPYISAILYFVVFMLVSIYTPPLIAKLGYTSESIQYLITLIISVFVFYLLSIAILVYFKSWLNWVVPWAIFQMMDGKILIKRIFEKTIDWFKHLKRATSH